MPARGRPRNFWRRPMAKHKYPTKEKAKKMLKENQAQGKPLSKAQKGLFGVIAGGKKPTRVKRPKRKR